VLRIQCSQRLIRLLGAPFQWAAIFQKSDMAFENGAENLRFYNSGSKSSKHELPCKVSCAQCGTLIMDEGRNMALLFPTLLKFQNEIQKKNFEVQFVAPDIGSKVRIPNYTNRCHIFYPQKPNPFCRYMQCHSLSRSRR
jgi:hypothetical protein